MDNPARPGYVQVEDSLWGSSRAALLQEMQIGHARGVLTLESESKTASLYLIAGRLLDAAGEAGGEGDEIVIDALGWPSGRYRFDPSSFDTPAKRSPVRSSLSELIAGAERRKPGTTTTAPTKHASAWSGSAGFPQQESAVGEPSIVCYGCHGAVPDVDANGSRMRGARVRLQATNEGLMITREPRPHGFVRRFVRAMSVESVRIALFGLQPWDHFEGFERVRMGFRIYPGCRVSFSEPITFWDWRRRSIDKLVDLLERHDIPREGQRSKVPRQVKVPLQIKPFGPGAGRPASSRTLYPPPVPRTITFGRVLVLVRSRLWLIFVLLLVAHANLSNIGNGVSVLIFGAVHQRPRLSRR